MKVGEKTGTSLGGSIYQSSKKPSEYRRIAGGIAWSGVKPPFAVVIGEEPEEAGGKTRLRILAAAENFDLQRLLERCSQFRDEYSCKTWYGNPDDPELSKALQEFDKKRMEKNLPPVHIAPAPHIDDLNPFGFYTDVVKKHMDAGDVLLGFGKAEQLKEYISKEPWRVGTGARMEDYPAITALGFALSALRVY
jgi:hypothetical protein